MATPTATMMFPMRFATRLAIISLFPSSRRLLTAESWRMGLHSATRMTTVSQQLSRSVSTCYYNRMISPVYGRWWSSSSSSEQDGGELPWTDIGTDQLVAMLKEGDIQLIDVRELEELEEHGRIPQSIHVPLGEVEEAFKMSPEAFSRRYNAVKPGKDDGNIVFHCRAGVRSRTAMTAAHELGYSKARHYYNGFLGWQEHLENQK